MRRVTITEGSLKDEMPIERRRKEKAPQPETWGQIFKAWPKTTLCIVSNEFCERFSYYGMRTVLTLYLLNVLKFSDNVSTVFFNGFTVLCYLTPLLGSIIADGYIGKFKTIFMVSILYAAGQIVLAFSSMNNSSSPLHPALDLAGLGIIAFGTGGIKPCVASFGGDQFEPDQTRMLSLFFSVFYFSINAGSMISTFISPMFRSMSCMGQDSCYPLAFGIPAILMIVATVIFMLGSFNYKKPPPKENIFGEVGKLMTRAICSGGDGPKRNHWLEKYLNTHRCENDPKCIELKRKRRDQNACQKAEFIEDVKSLLRVLVMYLPVPMFWALYDQQGSVWLIQGIQMDCRLWGSTLLLPDQMQTLNAVLILAFIPIFQVIVYPILSKIVTLTPLRKMVAGGVVAALAFVVSGLVQIEVNKTLPELPNKGYGFVSIMNALDKSSNCSILNAGPDHKTLPFNTV
jgi:dipeptide/tripeptide permease